MNDNGHCHTLIACIGNIFLGDDGFGCEVARALEKMSFPAGVKVVDYGIRGLDLAYALLEPYRTVILVDAIARGAEPGTVSVLQPNGGAEMPQSHMGLDPHSMDPAHLLAMARMMGDITATIYIVGCEPLDFGDELEGRMGLSKAVAAAVLPAAEAVVELIGRTCPRKSPDVGGIVAAQQRA